MGCDEGYSWREINKYRHRFGNCVGLCGDQYTRAFRRGPRGELHRLGRSKVKVTPFLHRLPRPSSSSCFFPLRYTPSLEPGRNARFLPKGRPAARPRGARRRALVLRIRPYEASMSGMNVTQVEARGSPARDSSSRPGDAAHRHRSHLPPFPRAPPSALRPAAPPRSFGKNRSYIRNLQPGSSSFNLVRKINRSSDSGSAWQLPARLQARCHMSRPRETFPLPRRCFWKVPLICPHNVTLSSLVPPPKERASRTSNAVY